MRLKVFKLKNGKLEYTGIREVQQGDVILEGETSMAETVHLREAAGVGPTQAELEKARQSLKAEANEGLKAAFKRLRPDATERELDVMVSGKAPQDDKPEWIK
jgi:hypothetical protein